MGIVSWVNFWLIKGLKWNQVVYKECILYGLIGGPRGVVGSDNPLGPPSRKWKVNFFGFIWYLSVSIYV